MNFYNNIVSLPRKFWLRKLISQYKEYKNQLKILKYPTNDKRENKRLKRLAWKIAKAKENHIFGFWFS